MNTPLAYRLFAVVAFATLCTSISLAQKPSQQYSWVDWDEQHYAELAVKGKPVVRYMYAPMDDSSAERRAETYKPYLHVYSPDGSQIITKGPGGRYPHHRGIYIGFNKITYGDNKKCDTWHCTGKAYEQHARFAAIEADEDGGILESVVEWHGQDGETFATENRKQQIAVVDGMTCIDFSTTLTPAEGVANIHLDGDPQHAGVQFRASQKVADDTAKQTYYLRTDGKGKEGETRNWNHRDAKAPLNEETANRPWLGMCFVLDGQRYTVLYLDHPSNPKPACYSERDYGRFGSYFVTDVTAESPLKVKYRYYIKQGEMTVEECQSLCDKFTAAE